MLRWGRSAISRSLRLAFAGVIAFLAAFPSGLTAPVPRAFADSQPESPAEGALVEGLSPLFRWRRDDPPRFTQVLVEKADGGGTVTWIAAPSLDRGTPPEPLAPNTQYTWQLRSNPDSPSEKPAGWGSWSVKRSFRTPAAAGAPPAAAPAATGTVTVAPSRTATPAALAATAATGTSGASTPTPTASPTPTPSGSVTPITSGPPSAPARTPEPSATATAAASATPNPRATGVPLGAPIGGPPAPPLWPEASIGDPPSVLSLEDQGYVEQIVRGSAVTLDMYFPGAGRFKVGDNNLLTVALAHSEIVDPAVSTITVLINEVPQRTWFMTPATSRLREYEIPITKLLLKPDLNKIEIRIIMRLPRDGCADTSHPALSATIFRQTRIKYDFLPGFPRDPWEPPDLARFPETLMEPSAIQSN
ncbi:MAG: cellulose biosynthesis cyclic di-GMP-binding regulatory protein BcsB, partial [Chloroflexi bacterium]|nr:cellulose biosynthesis cyclic di-GMP-binding regulatory protein BcsB [Chloroflexota bacterium]